MSIQTPPSPNLPSDLTNKEDVLQYLKNLRANLDDLFRRVYQDFLNGNSQFREVTATPSVADLDEGEFVLYKVGTVFRIYSRLGNDLVYSGVSTTGGVVDWSGITNKPASTVTQIDAAVTASHAIATAGVGISIVGQVITNTGGTVSFGTLASRPAFGTSGRIYIVVGDATLVNNGHIWLDTGIAWACATPYAIGQLSQ